MIPPVKKYFDIQSELPDLKFVSEILMGEDVDKEFPSWMQEPGHLRHQPFIISHVLEHFHRNDPVEFLIGCEIVDVSRDDSNILQTAPGRFGVNKKFLCARV